MKISRSSDQKSQTFITGLKFQENEWAVRDVERGFLNPTEKFIIYNINDKDEIVASAKVKLWGGVFQIQGLIVAKNKRRLSYGSKLLDKLLSEAKKNHCHMVYVSTLGVNQEAIDFYLSRNFEKTTEIPNTFFGISLVVLTMIVE